MVARLRDRRIGIEKCCFDEKNVSIFRKPDDFFNICIRKAAINNIGELAASDDLHDLPFEMAKGKGRQVALLTVLPLNLDQSIVRGAADNRVLETPKPWPDRKPHGLGFVAPDIDMSPFFECKCKHGFPMIEGHRANLKAGLL